MTPLFFSRLRKNRRFFAFQLLFGHRPRGCCALHMHTFHQLPAVPFNGTGRRTAAGRRRLEFRFVQFVLAREFFSLISLFCLSRVSRGWYRGR